MESTAIDADITATVWTTEKHDPIDKNVVVTIYVSLHIFIFCMSSGCYKQIITADVDIFVNYTKARASVDKILSQYYGNETQQLEEVYFPGACFEFSVDAKSNLYFGNLFVASIRVFFSQNKVLPPISSTESQLYANYIRIMLQQEHILKRLDNAVRDMVLKLTEKMPRGELGILKWRVSELLEKLQILPFRKL